jgi:hypothetical protein
VSIVTTANNILYGRANIEFRVGVCMPWIGVGGFDAAGVGGRKSIGEVAGKAMMLLMPNIEDAGIGDGAAIDGVGCENDCNEVR